MEKTQITVKKVDAKTFQELRAEAVRGKMDVGFILTLAMKDYLAKQKKKRRSLSEWKPTDWGPGTERLSEQVDEIIYGDN